MTCLKRMARMHTISAVNVHQQSLENINRVC